MVGKLKESQSFSELSVLLDEPIDCTILTDKNVELGIIRKERIPGIFFKKILFDMYHYLG